MTLSAARLGGMVEHGLPVGESAARLGVTVRTLHHWHEIGLVAPSGRSAAGYRLYAAADLGRAQRVLAYRALGLPLDRIAALLDGAGDLGASLREQRRQLSERAAELQGMIDGVERMIAAHDGGIALTVDQQLAAFGPDWDPAWVAEARDRWGGTAAWAEYAERAALRDEEDWRRIGEAAQRLDRDLASAFRAGVTAGDAEADALAERHRASIGAHFDCTLARQVCIARGYRDDPRLAAHYDALAPGLADWLIAIIGANAAAQGVDPATAVWD